VLIAKWKKKEAAAARYLSWKRCHGHRHTKLPAFLKSPNYRSRTASAAKSSANGSA
jgi:hypothetical protein